jgi:hypothetical protein
VCQEESNLFIKAYSDLPEIPCWKYLYRAHILIAKLFQMLNSLERSSELMQKASAIVEKHELDKEGKHHGILMRNYGYQYWKFFKK